MSLLDVWCFIGRSLCRLMVRVLLLSLWRRCLLIGCSGWVRASRRLSHVGVTGAGGCAVGLILTLVLWVRGLCRPILLSIRLLVSPCLIVGII